MTHEAAYGSRANAPIYVRDYLPADGAGGDAVAETAAFQAACDAAGIKGCVVLPDATILLNAEVVTAFTDMTIMGGSEKSYIKLTTPGARLRINSFRVRLINFRVNGQDLANNGIVFSNGGRAKAFTVRFENCLADGWLLDSGSVPGGNCNLITLYGCESIGNNGSGYAVANHATARDATSFRLIECEGTSNSGHGALLRDNQPGVVGGSYMSNGGFGIKLGEAGDTLPTTGAQIRYPRIEGNTLGPFSEGVGTDAIIELNNSYSDAVPGGSGGTSGYVVNATGNSWRLGYSGTNGGMAFRHSGGGMWVMRSTDGATLTPGALYTGPVALLSGSASPEGTVSALRGSLYLQTAGTATAVATLWHKTTGSGSTNTGWVPVGARRQATAPTADYAVTATDQVILASGSATATITLPAAATAGNGRTYTVTRAGSGAKTVAAATGNINGAATYSLAAQYDSRTFMAFGSDWYTI